MELGRHTAASHREIGVEVAKVCDLLITVGLRSQALAESAIEAGFKEKKILQFDDSVSAANSLKDLIKSNDVILVKGSQSTRMEKVVKEIMAEPEKAGELLVRQDEEWLLR